MKISLGQKIKELRDKKGLSQDELSVLVGVSKSSISLWEIDKTQPTSKKILKLAEIFNVDSGYFKDENLPKLDNKENGVPMETFLDVANELRDLNRDLNQRLKNEIAYEQEIRELRLKIQELEFRLKQG